MHDLPRFSRLSSSRLACVALALVLPLLTACTNKTSDKSLVFVTVDQGQKLATGERSLLGKVTAATWVDARTKDDYDAGHIPGALSLPFERATFDHYLIKDKPIVIVYGADYNDARANGMSKRLRELLPGRDIRTLDGGVRAWTTAGLELEATSGAAATGPSPSATP